MNGIRLHLAIHYDKEELSPLLGVNTIFSVFLNKT